MSPAAQPSLLTNDHPCGLLIEIKVSATGDYVWGRLITTEHSGRQVRSALPHTMLTSQVLGLPDDMRDLFTAWLYARPEEVRRVWSKAVQRWQDDCDGEGGHPAPNH